jgi:hypothetical protein
VRSGEATNTNFIFFGLTRPVLELTIYRTRVKHANHYATVAVEIDLIMLWYILLTEMMSMMKVIVTATVA